jgi:hypothetical protein
MGRVAIQDKETNKGGFERRTPAKSTTFGSDEGGYKAEANTAQPHLQYSVSQLLAEPPAAKLVASDAGEKEVIQCGGKTGSDERGSSKQAKIQNEIDQLKYAMQSQIATTLQDSDGLQTLDKMKLGREDVMPINFVRSRQKKK